MLERSGYNVTHVENGRDAISACENYQFDLILMDYHMPIMDGLTAVKAIQMRQEERGKFTPIFMLTADNRNDVSIAAINAGTCGVLEKPLTIDALALAFRATEKNAA
ncbi:MAG: response regulator [Ahrensia sp.]|nr:response regulator [Ahrensia sp.]